MHWDLHTVSNESGVMQAVVSETVSDGEVSPIAQEEVHHRQVLAGDGVVQRGISVTILERTSISFNR